MHPAWVAVAVANVWAAPGTATIPNDPSSWSTLPYATKLGLVGHMPTQALYGERVLVLRRQGAWVKIAIPDQPSPLDRRGYPGWLLGSQLRPTSPGPGPKPLPATRAGIVRWAKRFLGLRYLWGGLSHWGYDCSGLTWADYRAHGVTIPRDSEAQFTAGRTETLAQAKPGDLIFYEGRAAGACGDVHRARADDRGAELGERGEDRPDPSGVRRGAAVPVERGPLPGQVRGLS